MSLPQFQKLKEPFPSADIEWRIQNCGKTNDGRIWAVVLPYITARAVMDRLDDVLGCEKWDFSVEEITGGFLGRLTVTVNYPNSDGEPDTYTVQKTDGAPRTQIEDIKGGISDALKRVAVHVGIGRYLYRLDQTFFAEITEDGIYRGRLKDNTNFRWNPPRLPKDALPVEEQK